MELSKFIKEERGNATKLAFALQVSLSYLSQMASGTSPVSPERCLAIERVSNGKVARQELRPNDYWLIWPDLEQPSDKALIDIPATTNQSE